jgi:hypothetical protein
MAPNQHNTPWHWPPAPQTQRGSVPLRMAGLMALVILLLLAGGAVFVGLRLFGPADYRTQMTSSTHYDPAAMQQALDAANVAAEQQKLLALGSRFLGQPGMYAAADYIRTRYRQAGLEIHEQENWTVAPHTELREISAVDVANTRTLGTALPDVQIYPFMPNHLQPIAMPDEGVVGRLVLLTSATLRARARFDDCIGVIDTQAGHYDREFGFDWRRYAQLGLKALIVAHAGGLDQVPWEQVAEQKTGMVASIPINFPRLAADEGIFHHIGEPVRLRIRVRFENTRNDTIIGILRSHGSTAATPNRHALVLLTNYDATSILPDLAPGGAQAISVAAQLALLKGIEPYRASLSRDIIFVAFGSGVMARDGDNNLLRILDENLMRDDLGPVEKIFATGATRKKMQQRLDQRREARLRPWVERQQKNRGQEQLVEKILACFSEKGFLRGDAATRQALASFSSADRDFFNDQIKYVLETVVFESSENTLQAKLAFLRGNQALTGPTFQHYMQVKQHYDRAVALSGLSLASLLDPAAGPKNFPEKEAMRKRWQARFEELKQFHTRRERQLAGDIDTLKAFNAYEELIVFDNKLLPARNPQQTREVLTFCNGEWVVSPQMRAMTSLFASARQRLMALGHSAIPNANLVIPTLSKWHSQDVDSHTLPVSDRSSVMWTRFGYLIYTLINFDRAESYRHLSDPVDEPWMHNVASLANSLAVAGETILSIGHGNGTFTPIQLGWLKKQFGGQVLASNIGQSLTPSYPLQGAVLASRSFPGWAQYSWPGFYNHPLMMTDVYGHYEMINAASDFWVDQYTWLNGYSPVAAWYGRNGEIQWMKDEADDGQRVYKSVNLNWFDAEVEDITLVAFRAAPVAVLDMINPQTMKDFSGYRLINRDGLSAFRKECRFEHDGMRVTFVEPTQYCYAVLESGSPENELAREVRAFMLGVPLQDEKVSSMPAISREIDGPGYLAADSPFIMKVPFEIARSMLQVNGKRLNLQNHYGIADEMTNNYNGKASQLYTSSTTPQQPLLTARLEAREAATYTMLNHPVLRRTIWEAVLGIMWYLALLVPFAFFFEKMVFGNADLRWQIAIQMLVFVAIFGMLRVLHPAFAMVRSSIMILLGFVIIMISGGMTLLFSGKFKENLEELRRRRGQVDAAEVNRLGVMGSAFMLGLNNMHRRKLRTGLTCATLTLMTFAMICFTSVQSNVVDDSVALGKAWYQGLLIKRENFRKISDAELFAIQSRYGDRFQVCPRKLWLGTQNWLDNQGYNPELEVTVEQGGRKRSASAASLLQLTSAEPLREQLRFVGTPRWFTPEDQIAAQGPCPIIISNEMADQLGISPEMLTTTSLPVHLNGQPFAVRAIFDSNSLDNYHDLNGRDVLPYNVAAMSNIQQQDSEIVATENDPKIPARQLILAPWRYLNLTVPNGMESVQSVAVVMPPDDYKTARTEIDAFLEQTARPAFYGLQGVAYSGERTRKTSLAGMLDMLIPLLIAALTVLNTMKGSVYERRDEIAVYNAVGIAPRYIMFMFFAEAFVYAVIGSVLGYLLSQGLGWTLTHFNLTGGLTMSFTSSNAIYASLAITGAVFLSTWFPARSALEIAKPAEEAGWTLPEPVNHQLHMDLPFTFNPRDRIALLAFCQAYFQDHGEGGAGRFTAAEPQLDARPGKPAEHTDVVPRLTTTIWIKPMDLGVSQRLELLLPFDLETDEFKAQIVLTQLSGTSEAWLRLNHGFVSDLRRHILHWRAVKPEQRASYFEQARATLENSTPGEAV